MMQLFQHTVRQWGHIFGWSAVISIAVCGFLVIEKIRKVIARIFSAGLAIFFGGSYAAAEDACLIEAFTV